MSFDDYRALVHSRNSRRLDFAEMVRIVANDVTVSPGRVEEVLARENRTAADLTAAVEDLRRQRRRR
jgi:hypothetical protein